MSIERAVVRSVRGAVATRSQRSQRASSHSSDPVAIAPGTDLIMVLERSVEADISESLSER